MGHDHLLPALMASSSFEEAAEVALKAVLAEAEAALADSAYASRGRLLRGMVYIHPGDGYRRLCGIEHRSGAPVDDIGYFASAGVWRWIEEHRCSVSIDVQLEAIRPWLPDDPLRPVSDGREASGLPGPESRERLLSREATHLHVVPLRTPDGRIGGLISLEASCKAATGHEFIWGACNDAVRLCADIAAPYLCTLPPGRPRAVATDELLPVVGASTAHLIEMLRVFARQDETLLLSGATGVGKSRLGRWCHEQSRRRGGEFEVLDLLSVPEELQMAELFGWRRGAFTGAVKDNPGAIARAEGGTIFIDEIDKLSLKAQAGLLHVLEERRYRPLGDDARERRADVRFLVGTNADLRASVRARRFREDLYYRISVLPVRLPALAERLDELPQWAEYMVRRRHGETSRDQARLVPGAIALLLEASWPGNLRQLDNVVRRAYALALHDRGGAEGDLVLERRHIERALAYEDVAEPGSLVALLWQAAGAFVEEAERRGRARGGLPLELCDAFRGMVLGVALQRLGDRDQAFELLGHHQTLRHRNHHKVMRRELEKVRELLRALGGGASQGLTALLDEIDAPAERQG
ncbi:MAG TPA: sigma 54-interacting transcriptional regulator [Kofleriaceae bacterium]|nr:sigma 54-interacting transcriptional regulator [Kofleriaceae bacterium]